ncbi:hypothetical protein H4R18_005312 [Coemansia javaensis]|uniref:Uncharacterized protein n=1 Tax=Coemansia javaensis TaxID=2761396 RepID=A0A9W8LFJ6_9FUNG|nr:hypothetical protein H4R18_005312 [Coemansia javaensis]
MRPVLVLSLLAAAAAAGTIQDERDSIARIAGVLGAAKAGSDAFAGALQQLAVVLSDSKAAAELRADPDSDEFRIGQRTLLADVNRAMWVFYDDKPTLEHLRAFARRIHDAL